MRYRRLTILLLIATFALSFAASAQTDESEKVVKKALQQNKPPKVSTEFGLSAGAFYNFMEIVPVSKNFAQTVSGVFGEKVSGNIGAIAALQFRLNIGKTFGIQPEILYTYSTLKFTGPEYKNPIKVKCNLVQLPILLSFRAAMFRFNFGPVITLTDNPKYELVDKSDDSIKSQQLLPLNPTITYAAGVSVQLSRRTIIDIRWASQFMDTKYINEFYWSLDKEEQPDAEQFYIRNSSIQLRFGVVF